MSTYDETYLGEGFNPADRHGLFSSSTENFSVNAHLVPAGPHQGYMGTRVPCSFTHITPAYRPGGYGHNLTSYTGPVGTYPVDLRYLRNTPSDFPVCTAGYVKKICVPKGKACMPWSC